MLSWREKFRSNPGVVTGGVFSLGGAPAMPLVLPAGALTQPHLHPVPQGVRGSTLDLHPFQKVSWPMPGSAGEGPAFSLADLLCGVPLLGLPPCGKLAGAPSRIHRGCIWSCKRTHLSGVTSVRLQKSAVHRPGVRSKVVGLRQTRGRAVLSSPGRPERAMGTKRGLLLIFCCLLI